MRESTSWMVFLGVIPFLIPYLSHCHVWGVWFFESTLFWLVLNHLLGVTSWRVMLTPD